MSEKKILKVDNVSKNFGGIQAVKDVSFDIYENEILGIIGPNGAGKSTVFNLITGYYPVSSGKVYYNDEDITHLRPHQVCHKGITRTFQVARPLGTLTVSENVLIGLLTKTNSVDKAKGQVNGILDRLGLSHKKNSCGNDLTTMERKRLEVARALATEPDLLLLDETMTGLKPQEQDMMLNVIMDLKKEMTIVVVEHVMRVIMSICERIVVLDQGEKLIEGLPDDVLNSQLVMDAYLGGVKLA